MSKFKDIEQLSSQDLESFFDGESTISYDFVEAAARSKLPRAFVSRHTYLAAVNETRLVMWAKHRSLAKSLADVSCSIDLEELSIDDTWSKRSKKGCELYFPDGQRVIIESTDPANTFVETLTEAIAAIHGQESSHTGEHTAIDGPSVFTESGVAHAHAPDLDAPKAPAKPSVAATGAKQAIVTREVIIESLKRANEGSISPTAIKSWAMKVRDCKIIDADEAMVSYILFSLSRLDTNDVSASQEAIAEYYERLTVTLV